MKSLQLKVCGRDIEIDFEEERVHYPRETSEKLIENINSYLILEGFLDESYVKEMKSK